jgi:hypothetical protein
VDPTPLADFLAGSVLTTVLPLALLLGLCIWYWLRMRSIPDADTAMRGPAVEDPPEETSVTPGEPGTGT